MTEIMLETEQEPEEEKDDEGLLKHGYDVIVCGTGLVQSIVASALARAGKSVLHCDGADYYGEMDAVWTLDQIMAFQKQQKEEEEDNQETKIIQTNDDDDNDDDETMIPLSPHLGTSSLKWHVNNKNKKSTKSKAMIQQGTLVTTPQGNGSVQQLPTNTNPQLGVQLLSSSLEDDDDNDNHCLVYFEIQNFSSEDMNWEMLLEEQHGVVACCQTTQEENDKLLIQQGRYWALDATPMGILASGQAVQGMLASGVADYLEFKSCEGLYWLDNNDNNNNNILSRVPCSKHDVFATKLLKPMEKRRLMKFIQMTMDYAHYQQQQQTPPAAATTAIASSSSKQDNNDDDKNVVQTLNERHLNQGRSLARPQNKAVATKELEILQQCMTTTDMSLDDFLQQQYQLSPLLRNIVRLALALETSNQSLPLLTGMTRLQHHLQALGRYGTTAFLLPMYGAGELSQAFCRSAAVFGATYLLRRTPLSIHIAASNDDDETTTPKKTKVAGIVLAGDPYHYDNNNHNNKNNQDNDDDGDDKAHQQHEKTIPCQHVVVPVGALPRHLLYQHQPPPPSKPPPHGLRLARRISLWNGTLLLPEKGNNNKNDEEQRHFIFLPPHHPQIGNSHVIHCVVMDDSMQVAPKGDTLVHMTTTVVVHGDDDGDDSITILFDKATQVLFHATTKDSNKNTVKVNNNNDNEVTSTSTTTTCEEIYQATFSHEVLSPPPAPAAATEKELLLPMGLHVCSHTGQVLTADEAFEQARGIFLNICPGMEFLGLSAALDQEIQERAADRGRRNEDDEERLMLESALGMIENNSTTSGGGDDDDDDDDANNDATSTAATTDNTATTLDDTPALVPMTEAPPQEEEEEEEEKIHGDDHPDDDAPQQDSGTT